MKTQQQHLKQIIGREGMSAEIVADRLGVPLETLAQYLLPSKDPAHVVLPVVHWIKATTTQQEFLREAIAAHGMTRAQFAERISTPIKTLNKWMQPPGPTATVMPDNMWRFISEIVDGLQAKGRC